VTQWHKNYDYQQQRNKHEKVLIAQYGEENQRKSREAMLANHLLGHHIWFVPSSDTLSTSFHIASYYKRVLI
jgi:hypothetical protein